MLKDEVEVIRGGATMKTLVLGAGAVGGYFGGRLLEKGEDVTFLVRDRRDAQLKEDGLILHSSHGDAILQPKTIHAGSEKIPFDIVLIATKAFHLNEALEAVKPFVEKDTTILPLLNGIKHMEVISSFFSEKQVIGGLCFIESTLDEAGHIVQTSDTHELVFGEWNGEKSARIKILEEAFSGTKATIRKSNQIQQDMWHKYLFITALSGITSLMRSPIGAIRNTLEGSTYIQQLFEEIRIVMSESGAPIAEGILIKQLGLIEKQDPSMKSSMLRDIEKQGKIEADHIQGYLLSLAEQQEVETPLLRLIYRHLKIYEQNR